MNEFQASGEILTDPVCGMTVAPDTPYRTTWQGQEYLFCSPHCLEKFQENPEQYLESSQAAAPSGTAAETYFTCPMHPEVRQPQPGTCPQCGMALEPVAAGETPAPPQEPQEEVQEFLDPVCGMTVGPDSPYHFSYEGQEFRFCSESCLHRFQEHPESYLQEAAAPPKTAKNLPLPGEPTTPAPWTPRCGKASQGLAPCAVWSWSRRAPRRGH